MISSEQTPLLPVASLVREWYTEKERDVCSLWLGANLCLTETWHDQCQYLRANGHRAADQPDNILARREHACV